MNIFIGLLIGVVVGVLQFLLLSKYNAGVIRMAKSKDGEAGGRSFMLAGILQLLLPFAALLLVAFLYTDALVWAGTGIAGSLILLASLKMLLGRRRK